MGDLGNTNNGTEILINDNQETFTVQNTAGTNVGLAIDLLSLNYVMGDFGGVGITTMEILLDSLKTVTIGTLLGFMQSLNQDTGQYEIGDIDNINNGMRFLLDDTGRDAVIYGGAFTGQRLLAYPLVPVL